MPKSRNSQSRNKKPDDKNKIDESPKIKVPIKIEKEKPKISKDKVFILSGTQKFKFVKHRNSMEELLRPEIVKSTSFDTEMQKRGLKERIKSIESLNNYLSTELGRNTVRRCERNSALYKETSTNSTILRKANGESNKHYLNSMTHMRSSSNMPLNVFPQNPSSPSISSGKIVFPFQRRPQEETKKVPAKFYRENIRGPVSPKHHFVQVSSKYFEEHMLFKSEDFTSNPVSPNRASLNKSEGKSLAVDYVKRVMMGNTKTKEN